MTYAIKRLFIIAALLLALPLAASALAPRDTILISDRYTTHVILPSAVEAVDAGSAPIMLNTPSAREDLVAIRAKVPFYGAVTVTVEDVTGAFRPIAVVYAPTPEFLVVDLRKEGRHSVLLGEVQVMEVTKKKNTIVKTPGRVLYADMGAPGMLETEVVGDDRDNLLMKTFSPFSDSTNFTLYDATGTLHTYLVRYRKTTPKKLSWTLREKPLDGPRKAPAPEAPKLSARDTIRVSGRYTTHVVFPAPLTALTVPQGVSFHAVIVEGHENVAALYADHPFDGTVSIAAEDADGSYRLLAVAHAVRPERLVMDLRRDGAMERRRGDIPVVAVTAKKALRLRLPSHVAYADLGPASYLTSEISGNGKDEVLLRAPKAFADTTNMTFFDGDGELYSYLVRYDKKLKLQEIDLRPPKAEEPVKAAAVEAQDDAVKKAAEQKASEEAPAQEDLSVKEESKDAAVAAVAEPLTQKDQPAKEAKAKEKKAKEKKEKPQKDKGSKTVREEKTAGARAEDTMSRITADAGDDAFSSALTVDAAPVEEPAQAPETPQQKAFLGEGRDTLFVSDIFTTHMIFPSEINYADLSNQKLVAAKIVEGSKNKLAIKARGPFTSTASLSLEEANGAFHTYIVAYGYVPTALILDMRHPENPIPKDPVQTVEISDKYTTHFIFGTDINYADLSRPSILAGKLVDQGRNKLALKAKAPFDGLANVSVEEANGTFHTYYLRYAQSPQSLVVDARPAGHGRGGVTDNFLKRGDAPSLQAVAQLPRQLYHTAIREYDLTLACENVFAYSDITYLVITLKNGSAISYETEDAIFVLETKQGGRRRPPIESTILPKNKFGKLTTGPYQESRVAYSFEKITLAKDQRICVYVYESGGRRELKLTLTAADINGATSPFSR